MAGCIVRQLLFCTFVYTCYTSHYNKRLLTYLEKKIFIWQNQYFSILYWQKKSVLHMTKSKLIEYMFEISKVYYKTALTIFPDRGI